MADPTIQLQLQEARRALRVCTGERDRSREEARQLRAQLRALRAELQAVRPVEQRELLAAQQALREAQEQTRQAREARAQAQTDLSAAQAAGERATLQAKQARMESDMSLERIIELREELTRLRANQSINASAVAMLRAQLDAVRQEAEAPEPEARVPVGAPESAAGVHEALAPAAEHPQVSSNAEPPPPEDAAQEPEGPTPNTAFDLPEGAIWEFEGVAEPEFFMDLCVKLCAKAAGDYLRIGHFEGQVEGRDWAVVFMAGPEHSVRDFLVALDRDNMRLMSATGLPLVRIQPTRWSANVLNANYEQVAPTRFARVRELVVSGALKQQEGGQ